MKSQSKEILLVAANYFAPTEFVRSENGECTIQEGTTVYDSSIEVPEIYKTAFEYYYNYETKSYEERPVEDFNNSLYFDKLEPGEFKFFKLVK